MDISLFCSHEQPFFKLVSDATAAVVYEAFSGNRLLIRCLRCRDANAYVNAFLGFSLNELKTNDGIFKILSVAIDAATTANSHCRIYAGTKSSPQLVIRCRFSRSELAHCKCIAGLWRKLCLAGSGRWKECQPNSKITAKYPWRH